MKAGHRPAAPALLTPQECEALGRRVLELANGSQAQVHIQSGISASSEFARGDAYEAYETSSIEVQLDLEVSGNRQARGRTTQVDEAGLRALVREVQGLTREQRTPRNWSEYDMPPILPPQVYPEGPQIFFNAAVDAMTSEAQADVFRRATDAADAAGLIAAGAVSVSAYAGAVLNTRGLWAYQRSAFSQFSLTARTTDGTGSGWAWSGYEDWSRVDVAEVIRRAVALGRRSAHPTAVEPGRYTVILEPAAVAELINPIQDYPTGYWSAQMADAGATLFSDEPPGANKIGRQMLDRRLALVSDPWDPEHPKSTRDGVGHPLVAVTWFKNGVLQNLAYDAAYARQKGREPVFVPGGVRLTADGPSQNLDEMIASTKRGIWVNRLSGVSVMNFRTLLLSGTTRDGTFLIENGKITKPIKNLRFTESPFFVLNGLEAWGEPVRASRSVVAPRLKLRDFNFTSLSDAV